MFVFQIATELQKTTAVLPCENPKFQWVDMSCHNVAEDEQSTGFPNDDQQGK